jgi:hypothetical protein
MNLVWRLSDNDATYASEIVDSLKQRGVDAEIDSGIGAFDPETAILLVSNLVSLAAAIADLLPKLRRGAEVDVDAGEMREAADVRPGTLRVVQSGRTIEYEGATSADLQMILAQLPPV